MRHDVIAEIVLRPTSEGGRMTAINPPPGTHYGCPLNIAGHYFECRFDVGASGPIELGKKSVVPIAFLSPDLASPHFPLGATFELWEGKVIGVGKVVSVVPAANHSLQARRP